ncbi:MAG: EAL domain-containing protein [Geminicoccaceae bacterium]
MQASSRPPSDEDAPLRATGGIGLFTKLALLLVPAFALPAAIGLYWLAGIDIKAEHDRLTARIGNAAARVSSGIERHLGDGGSLDDDDLPQALINTLMSDQAVLCIELTEHDSGRRRLVSPPGIGCTGQAIEDSLDIPIYADETFSLIVHLSLAEILEAQRSRRELSLLMLLGGIAIALIATSVVFRLVVARPLDKLLAAIAHSNEQGLPGHVDHDAGDEIGQVIRAFNAMRRRLEDETARVREALARLDRIYNATPTLLFSTNRSSEITGVSEHWLRVTGHRRREVIGRPLGDFLCQTDAASLRHVVTDPIGRGEAISDVPLLLRNRNGTRIDILLSAVPDSAGSDSADTALCVMSDISALKDAERKLEKLVHTDPLCGLLNRRGMLEQLDRFLEQPPGREGCSAILFIDLDDFKWINDTYGHEAGDRLLVMASRRLRDTLRANDLVARLGGDEFTVFYRHLERPEIACQLASRIIASFKEPFALGAVMGYVSASIGIAFIEPHHRSASDVMRLADLAMYEAKQTGKSTFAVYSEEMGHHADRMTAIRDLIRAGLHDSHFSLHFQPIIDSKSGGIAGCEALMRLTCPRSGPVSPAIFVPVAEETGQIMELGTLALEKGIEALGLLYHGEGGADFHVAVNLSPRQLNDQLEEILDRLLEGHGELVPNLVLEITETMLLQRSDDIVRRLNALHARGIRIALDDFGTGYSSLSHIQNFPVDIIKIDKSFVAQLDGSEHERQRALAMIRATVSMAHDLGIKVVAEGVEKPDMLGDLEACRVDMLQGYHHARPMPLDELCSWMRAHRENSARHTRHRETAPATRAARRMENTDPHGAGPF